jgi:hypothetical protein
MSMSLRDTTSMVPTTITSGTSYGRKGDIS